MGGEGGETVLLFDVCGVAVVVVVVVGSAGSGIQDSYACRLLA